jgi:hypothetical protein
MRKIAQIDGLIDTLPSLSSSIFLENLRTSKERSWPRKNLEYTKVDNITTKYGGGGRGGIMESVSYGYMP